ncbi:MAG: YraN family protein [Eubacteriales bacterium]
MKKTNLRAEGNRGEDIACDYLKREGYVIIQRNFRSQYGEIDIIAENETHIIFIEVKSRTESPVQSQYGRPSLAVNAKKQVHILKSTKKYLQMFKPLKSPRIDVIEQLISPVEGTEFIQIKINHIKAAVHDKG